MNLASLTFIAEAVSQSGINIFLFPQVSLYIFWATKLAKLFCVLMSFLPKLIGTELTSAQ